MARNYRFCLADVFTSRAFGGNQLAVFTDARGLSPADMLTLTREMNLAECAFVLPATQAAALRRVRIFTPQHEMPFAGHPTIGTVFVLAAEGLLTRAQVSSAVLQLNVGLTPVSLEWRGGRASFAWMEQRPARLDRPLPSRQRVAAAFGLRAADLNPALPIQVVSTGVPYLIVPVRSLAGVRRAQPGTPDLRRLLTGIRTPERVPLAAYLFTLETHSARHQAHARTFSCPPDLPEDAATGSAAGPLAAYLTAHGRFQHTPLVIEQGYEMGRPSQLHAQVLASGRVRVGGQAVIIGEGVMRAP